MTAPADDRASHSLARWQVPLGLGVLALSGWLVLLFFEGDSCGDAGGAFHAIAYRCELADGRGYTTLVSRARWPFWVLHAALAFVLATALGALGTGLAWGLRSLWIDVIRHEPAGGHPRR